MADAGSSAHHEEALLIYHETQTAALCGVHALNTLLQGPYFSEVELAQIAQELDRLEHQLMAESGMESADFLQFVAQESSNVAADGMFSIQVLHKALEVWGLRAVPLNSPEAAVARADPQHQTAFICNLREHWFTVRSIYGQWWNLNSVFSAPEPVSDFYLSAFLGSLQHQGYDIFVIWGQLPAEPHPDSVLREGPGRWFTPDEAREEHERSKKLKEQGFLQAAYKGVLGKASKLGNLVRLAGPGARRSREDAFEGGDDPDLARALAASLAEHEDAGGPSTQQLRGGSAAMHDDHDADLAAAIAASLAEHAASQGGPPPVAGPGGIADLEAAGCTPAPPQLAEEPAAEAAGQAAASGQAAGASEAAAGGVAAAAGQAAAAGEEGPPLPELGPEPEAGQPGVVEVGLRLPDGSRHTRSFSRESDTVGHLAALAAAQGFDMAIHRLALRFPRKVFEDYAQTLEAAGIGNKEMLTVELKL